MRNTKIVLRNGHNIILKLSDSVIFVISLCSVIFCYALSLHLAPTKAEYFRPAETLFLSFW